MNSYTCTHTHTLTLVSKYPLVMGSSRPCVCVCVCAAVTETRQVFDACHTDRNRGLTSCVGLVLERDKGLYMGCALREGLVDTD